MNATSQLPTANWRELKVTKQLIEVPTTDWRNRPTYRWTTGYVVHLENGNQTAPMRRKELYSYARENSIKIVYA
jgi:hypothetical protein